MPAAAALAPVDYSLDIVPCDNRSCREAMSHPETCTCDCAGEAHGVPFRAAARAAQAHLAARYARRGGDVFLGAAAVDDEPW